MLKLIPQEQPDGGMPPKKQSKKTGNSKPQKNLPRGNDSIIELTGKKLIHYSMSPEGHTDQEVAQIIYDMHRTILHLQRKREDKRNKKRKN